MNKERKLIVCYSGRFQPFHLGHYNTFKTLQRDFPDADIYIATSDKTDKVKSPLNFKEKKEVITRMFPELSSYVKQVKIPYKPTEILENYDPEENAFIAVVSEKDSDRLKGQYFKPYKKGNLEGFLNRGYVWVAKKKAKDEMFKGEPISGTLVRSILGDTSVPESDKKDLFIALYDGKFDSKIFRLLTNKIVNEFLFLDYDKFLQIEEAKDYFNSLSEYININYDDKLITEGGAFGHLAHPYEEINITFGQMKEMVDDVLNNRLDYNVEKTDGQNLLISYKNGEVVSARNKGHLKNKGEKALNISGLQSKFAGRGELEKGFVTAMADLEEAISKLSQKDIFDIFQEGESFMTLEVIYPKNANVIPYGHSLLVFQGIINYDEEGNPLEYSRDKAKKLSKMIEDVNQSMQKEFKIMMQPSLEMPKNLESLKPKYDRLFNDIKKEYNLSDSNLIKDYLTRKWEDYLDSTKLDISDELKGLLVSRWVDGSKQPNLRELKSMGDDKFVKWISAFEKKEIKKVQKEIRKPFELLFLKLGSDILKEIKSVLTLDQRNSTEQMIASVKKTIKEIENSKNPDNIEKLKYELNRLEAIGGMDAIVPIEGIVFSKNDVLYKLTGTFAPVNSLMGILTYSR